MIVAILILLFKYTNIYKQLHCFWPSAENTYIYSFKNVKKQLMVLYRCGFFFWTDTCIQSCIKLHIDKNQTVRSFMNDATCGLGSVSHSVHIRSPVVLLGFLLLCHFFFHVVFCVMLIVLSWFFFLFFCYCIVSHLILKFYTCWSS